MDSKSIDKIVDENPVFKEGQNLKNALGSWSKVRDSVDKKYPNKTDMEKAELIGKIMKRLKLTDLTKGMK